MKSLILLFILFFSTSLCASKINSLRTFHFTWGFWEKTENGWGENTVKMDHYPTDKEILKRYVYKFDPSLRKRKVYVEIVEVTPEQEKTGYFLKRTANDRYPHIFKSHLGL